MYLRKRSIRIGTVLLLWWDNDNLGDEWFALNYEYWANDVDFQSFFVFIPVEIVNNPSGGITLSY